MQNDASVKAYVAHHLKNSFESSLGCQVNCEIEHINLFSPAITFKKISMKAFDGSWSWESSPLTFACWWPDIFFYGSLELYIDLHESTFTSDLKNNRLAIWPHLDQFISGASWSFPTLLRSFIIKKGSLCITDRSIGSVTNLTIASITKNIDGTYKSKVSIKNGSSTLEDKICVKHLSGPIAFDIVHKSGNLYLYLDSNCTFESPLLPENQTCFLYGKWKYDQGLFCIRNQDNSFVIEPIRIYFLGDTLFLSIDLATDLKTVTPLLYDTSDKELSGSCSIRFKSEYGPFSHGSSGFLVLQNVSYKDVDCFSLARLSFKQDTKSTWRGLLSLSRDDGAMITGDCRFDEKNRTFACNVSNKSEIIIPAAPYWKIFPQKSNLSLHYNNKKQLWGNYAITAQNYKLDSKLDITGNIGFTHGKCTVAGKINNTSYGLEILLNKTVRLKKCICTDEHNHPLFAIDALKDNPDKLHGYITFPFIKSVMSNYCAYDINGNGDLAVYAMIKNNALLCQLRFKDGSISVPGQYNFINGFKISCKLDPFSKSIYIKDLSANLHKGTIRSHAAVLRINDTYRLETAYLPLLFENCLINWDDELFALASGRFLLCKKRNTAPILKGITFIERSQLKRNIFSSEVQKQVSTSTSNMFESFLQDMLCDISVRTKDPVRVKTPFLETSANLNLTIRKSMLNPEVSGKIDFISGSMSFPYKPLYITKGSLYFFPHRPEDPIIELTAKNKINKYNVTLHATGSLLKHTISLDSSPPLSEEQIISLLIAGSAQESLNIVMPALIMQNLKGVIFGADADEDGKDYLTRLFKPFKHVYIVPSFTDQTGRGGLRGSVEIEISERWRALIQKNFSLSEDTRFEIECLLTDDISFRGFRDESGDIGAELEMKWDF